MLWTTHLSAKKLHSINVIDLDQHNKRNPRSGLPIKNIDGDHTLDEMKRIEIKVFGRLLFK